MNTTDVFSTFPLIHSAFNIPALILLYLFAFRPLLRWVETLETTLKPRLRKLPVEPEGGELPEGVPASSDARPDLPPSEETAEQRALKEARNIYDEVSEFIAGNPEKTADLLRAWMKEHT
jgi:flagellar biosynthesis/type III secretory pathway M-ring protein FliF/YscJ